MIKYKKYRAKSQDKDILKVFQSVLNKNNLSKNVYTSIFSCSSLHKWWDNKRQQYWRLQNNAKSIWIIEWHAFPFFVYLGCILILVRKSFFIGYKLWLLFINNSIYHSPVKHYAFGSIRNKACFTSNVIAETMSIHKQNKPFFGNEMDCNTIRFFLINISYKLGSKF